MKIKDAEGWEKCKKANAPSREDPGYGQAVLDYAVAWADAMEVKMAAGRSLVEVAAACEPKGHGITGAMYGMAVATLRDAWEHGEELNRWHNANYGQPDANGTVNPAILVIGR